MSDIINAFVTTKGVTIQTKIEEWDTSEQSKNMVVFRRHDLDYNQRFTFTNDELDQLILNLIQMRMARGGGEDVD